MKKNAHSTASEEAPDSSIQDLLAQRTLILASNRGPVTLHRSENGEMEYQRGSGGLVTALAGVIQHAEARWVACALTEEDRDWNQGTVPLGDGGGKSLDEVP
jgi:trehalose-6-phosphate synthase